MRYPGYFLLTLAAVSLAVVVFIPVVAYQSLANGKRF